MDINEVIKNVAKKTGNSIILKRKDFLDYAFENKIQTGPIFKELEKYKAGHGKYNVSLIVTGKLLEEDEIAESLDEISTTISEYVPKRNPIYLKTTYYEDLHDILSSKMFYPVMITGPSGVGKTLTVEQICAELKRELIRVNITHETDEDSLMGGFRLENGNTVYFKGPVIQAMEAGAILLLDEYDLGSPTRILCLQSVMEGKGYLLKRTGEFVKPKDGFTVIATANTKGQGDENGTYIGTQILNEAALDRFPILFEADFPSKVQERRILNKVAKSINLSIIEDEKDILQDHIEILCEFAESIRKTVRASNDIRYNISTRRLVDILKAVKIYDGNVEKAVKFCINRFDQSHKDAFMDTYRLLNKPRPSNKAAQTTTKVEFDEQPF